MGTDSDDVPVCPLCMDELDSTDQKFNPCQCGYQVCRFCFHQLLDTSAKCPACRTPYDPARIEFVAADKESVQVRDKEKERDRGDRDRGRRETKERKKPDNRKALANVRVIQRSLVYVTNLSLNYAKEEVLKKHEFFGQYGKILKVVVNRSNVYGVGSSRPSVSAYVTYVRKEDAAVAIQAVDGAWLDGKMVRASFGTTKYCTYFLRSEPCKNPECLYLHELGQDADSFTKEDMVAGSRKQHFHEAVGQTVHEEEERERAREGPVFKGKGLPPPGWLSRGKRRDERDEDRLSLTKSTPNLMIDEEREEQEPSALPATASWARSMLSRSLDGIRNESKEEKPVNQWRQPIPTANLSQPQSTSPPAPATLANDSHNGHAHPRIAPAPQPLSNGRSFSQEFPVNGARLHSQGFANAPLANAVPLTPAPVPLTAAKSFPQSSDWFSGPPPGFTKPRVVQEDEEEEEDFTPWSNRGLVDMIFSSTETSEQWVKLPKAPIALDTSRGRSRFDFATDNSEEASESLHESFRALLPNVQIHFSRAEISKQVDPEEEEVEEEEEEAEEEAQDPHPQAFADPAIMAGSQYPMQYPPQNWGAVPMPSMPPGLANPNGFMHYPQYPPGLVPQPIPGPPGFVRNAAPAFPPGYHMGYNMPNQVYRPNQPAQASTQQYNQRSTTQKTHNGIAT